MRTIFWNEALQKVEMIDQRALPGEFILLQCDQYQEVIDAIKTMAIRGAPAIGVAAAFGLALAARQSKAGDKQAFMRALQQAASELSSARPTAVNLGWAVRCMLEKVEASQIAWQDLSQFILDEAQKMADEDILINLRMARLGAELLEDGDTVIHHCNTGALAAVDWGTALGVIRMAVEKGKKIHVLVDETRPRLQGSRLTAWELQQYGISFEIISDNAAGYFLSRREVQKVLFGADRVAANGDVANKIGTYMLSLAAHHNSVPVYAVVPTSSIDITLAHGGLIPIEERSMQEVLNLVVDGKPVAPSGAKARNPAFDVTPNELITAVITEKGVHYPPFQFFE